MKRTLLFAAIAIVGVGCVTAGVIHKDALNTFFQNIEEVENHTLTPDVIEPEVPVEIQDIMDREDFKQNAIDEAYRIYYIEAVIEAEKALEQLDGRGFSSPREKVEALQSYLKKKGAPELAKHAEEIMQLPRWQEALAIIGHETQFCNTGRGSSQNNCGGIKRSDGTFKTYASKFDALDDVSFLLMKPLYRDKSLASINGTYCVYEEGPTGTGPCPHWTENVTKYLTEIKQLAMI